MSELTGAQRLAYGMGYVINSYPLGSKRRPEDVKFDLVCKLNDYLESTIKGFDSDTFMKNAGYSNRKPS